MTIAEQVAIELTRENKALRDAMPELQKRECRDCGNVAYHCLQYAPFVCCRKCGSQDTRITKEGITHEVRL